MSNTPMFHIIRKEMTWAGHLLALETGLMARQAAGAVMVHYGMARILCTVTIADEPAKSDFLPLSVHYIEKYFAAGRIPGGFVKRESKPSDHEVLTSRLIDRALRPLFASGFHHEVQVLCTVLSYDENVDIANASLLGASAAVLLAGLPFNGPVAGVRIGMGAKGFVENPSIQDRKPLDLILAGTEEGMVMVECQAYEQPETVMAEALDFGQKALVPVLNFVSDFVSEKKITPFSYVVRTEHFQTMADQMLVECGTRFHDICKIQDRYERKDALNAMRHDVRQALIHHDHDDADFHTVFTKLWDHAARRYMLDHNIRLDGRKSDEIRPIDCRVRLLPRVHGSALFTRGTTQALVTVTMGAREDSQVVDGLSGVSRDPFLLHYNFPSFSVGEVGRVGAPGRREIGHGKLAWRALQAVLPETAYTIRVVSEITESYGSSSMATICGTSLALMDAGVDLRSPVAGIAMGLVQENEKQMILSDISGFEDGIGDMDFKVGGTEKGITALQMDLKGQALTSDFMKHALERAFIGVKHILGVMQTQTISTAGNTVSPYAPAIGKIQIQVDKIRDLIGSGGKVIRELCESTGSKIDIADDGVVSIFSTGTDALNQTLERIKRITGVPEIGTVYQGVVVSIKDFGAFVSFGFAKDGMVHVSEIAPNRIENISEVLSVGDKVSVKLLDIDSMGRSKLSIKQV
jgi:polyribonucleotide nucleotidyltransferase